MDARRKNEIRKLIDIISYSEYGDIELAPIIQELLDALDAAEAHAIELEMQLVPLRKQFSDWAAQNRRAEAELADLKATISEAAVLGGVPGETYPATVMALAIHLNDAEGRNEDLRTWSAAWKRKAKMLRDWYFYAEKHIFRAQELSQRVNELEADNARLREVVTRTRAYLDVKKTWDNRLPELIDLKRAIAEMESAP